MLVRVPSKRERVRERGSNDTCAGPMAAGEQLGVRGHPHLNQAVLLRHLELGASHHKLAAWLPVARLAVRGHRDERRAFSSTLELRQAAHRPTYVLRAGCCVCGALYYTQGERGLQLVPVLRLRLWLLRLGTAEPSDGPGLEAGLTRFNALARCRWTVRSSRYDRSCMRSCNWD